MGVYGGVEKNWAALTNTGRTHVATKGVVQSGLVLNLDAGVSSSYGGSGTTWTDLSGNGNTGTLVNGVGYVGTNGGALSFDGVNDYVSCGKPSSLNFGVGSFSINVWFFVSTGNILKVLCGKGAASGSNSSGWWLAVDNRYNSNSNGLSFSVNSTSVNTSYGSITTTLPYSINTWNNISAVWNSTNKIAYLYLNTLLMNTTTTQQEGSGFSGVTDTDNANFNSVIASYDNGNSLYFPGNISQASIYNRALSASEISQNFLAMRARFGI